MQHRKVRVYGRILGFMLVAMTLQLVSPVREKDENDEKHDGRSSMQRGGNSLDATVGTEVLTGDLVFPVRGATVKVRCQDGSFGERTRVFGLADVCPNSRGRRFSQSGRGEDDFLAFLEDNFEYASQVSVGNPILRWPLVEEATAYSLRVWDCGQAVFNCTDEAIWEETVEGLEVPYNGPTLEPGRNYLLEVSAVDGSSPSLAYLTLRRLDEGQAAVLQAAVEKLETAEVSAEVRALALARIYLEVAERDTLPPEGVGLILEAIPRMEAVAAESTTPYVHRLLGDLYLQVGLLDAAQMAYEMVLSLSEQSDDLMSRAAAQVGLANVAAARGERSMAEIWLQQSRVNYVLLGEGERKELVEDWLQKLKL